MASASTKSDLARDLQDCNSKLSKALQENTDLKQQIDFLQSTIDELQVELNDSKNIVSHQHKEIDVLKKKSSSTEYESLSAKIDEIKSMITPNVSFILFFLSYNNFFFI